MTDQAVATRESAAGAAATTGPLVDADIHPGVDMKRVADQLSGTLKTKFSRFGHNMAKSFADFPRLRHGGVRLDLVEDGGSASGSLEGLARRHLDAYDIDYGMLIPLSGAMMGAGEPRLGAALCSAINDVVAEDWLIDPRLRGSISVPFESPELAAAEVHRVAQDQRFAQVMLPCTGSESLGNRKYWPIYAAAQEHSRPVCIHIGGVEQFRGPGIPSYYFEAHTWQQNSIEALTLSFIAEGVFEEFPDLDVVLVEGGVGWLPAFGWAMDQAGELFAEELHHLTKKPSEYLREHFWLTTQPIEEPADSGDLASVLEMSGMAEKIIFASDFPHWDFDSPTRALAPLPEDLRSKVMYENGARLYGF